MAILQAAGTADVTGKVTLSFVAPGQGVGYGGTVAVPGAEAASQWQCMLGSTPVGSWTGANTWGPIAGADGEVVSLQGTGLTPGKNYLAVWNFTQGPSDNYDNVIPAVSATTVLSPTVLGGLGGASLTVVDHVVVIAGGFGTVPLSKNTILNWGWVPQAANPSLGSVNLVVLAGTTPIAKDGVHYTEPFSDRLSGLVVRESGFPGTIVRAVNNTDVPLEIDVMNSLT